VVFSPLGPILSNLSSNLSSRSNHSNRSNHKPDPCLVSQARLVLEEVRRLSLTRFSSFKLFLFFYCPAFGSGGGGFGQNPQQQPQQANSMFGNIAPNPNPTPATGSSTFG